MVAHPPGPFPFSFADVAFLLCVAKAVAWDGGTAQGGDGEDG